MSKPLPRLRMDLDFMPSPVEDRPGLMIRDPFHYSDVTLIIPPPLVPVLAMFDGEQTEDAMCRVLLDMTGDVRVGELQRHLLESLEQAGFLVGERFEEMRAATERAFAESDVREPAHANGAYPGDPNELAAWMTENLDGAAHPSAAADGLIGIAAPHVSPDGGWDSYRAAYQALTPDLADKTFIVLGTSHYGQPETFGLTRKQFVTPFGAAQTDIDLVNRLAAKAPRAVRMEDYCHAIEHSIEFQIIFLQSIYGPNVKVLPILCGPFAKSLYVGGKPEDDEGVAEFFEALGDVYAREAQRLHWVLGVDMAHMGRRYGDEFAAEPHAGGMLAVAARDKERIEQLAAGDARGFWDRVQPEHDDLKWCGSAPFYTFLSTVPQAVGQLRHYEHWNIDAESVVTFGAMAFHKEL
ncbi:AmmeMemoRadiSam system protein B [Paludibaculum fermentans]|uniref:AmmeMemoRadiSam system protein B n=1 Tax=Paludibaculum fermentans TaxID=1473598 RepID=UPI003EBC55CD